MDGFEETGYSESARYALRHVRLYEWNAETGDLVSASDWLPLTESPRRYAWVNWTVG